MPCSVSSNIISGVSKVNSSKEASRLLITISQSSSSGLLVGDVIRYNVLDEIYEKSDANGIANSEVVGIVESINTDNSKNVVIYGSINLPPSLLLFSQNDTSGASGGNDIFFLSDVEPGKLQNLAPTDGNKVIKAVYQVAPHGSYTGIVINHIGYALGSDIPANFTSFVDNADVGNLHHYLTYKNNDNYIDNHPYKILPTETTQTSYGVYLKNTVINYYNKFGIDFGCRELLKLNSLYPVTNSIFNWFIFDYQESNLSNYNGKIVSTYEATNEIFIEKNGLAYQTESTTVINTNYWIEQNSTSRQNPPQLGIVDNPSAYLSQPIQFVESDVYELYLPVVRSVSIAAGVFDGDGTNLISATQQLSLNLIVKTEGSSQSLSIPSNATTNRLITNILTVDDVNVSSKLLELENRLTYLENRLSM